MSTQPSTSRQPRRWLVMALAICIGVPALLTMQGCCNWCVKKCPPCTPSNSTHAFTVVPDAQLQPSFVAPVPRQKVRRGDFVVFVNGSQQQVTIKADMSFKVFTEGDQIVLHPGEIVCRTVDKEATVGTTVTLNVTPLFPPPWYPGPGMDIVP